MAKRRALAAAAIVTFCSRRYINLVRVITSYLVIHYILFYNPLVVTSSTAAAELAEIPDTCAVRLDTRHQPARTYRPSVPQTNHKAKQDACARSASQAEPIR